MNNWNSNRKNNIAEEKILIEISNGLKKDIEDIKLNKLGHQIGVEAVAFFKNLMTEEGSVTKEDFSKNYFYLTRTFFSVQNTSGYESLKSRGFELIDNDSLRSKIINLYEYDYTILRKLEEEYSPNQFHQNYFHEINRIISPNIELDKSMSVKQINTPLKMSDKDRKIFVMYLRQIKTNRKFVLRYYNNVEKKINNLIKLIDKELNRTPTNNTVQKEDTLSNKKMKSK